jgi:hypothetical protein
MDFNADPEAASDGPAAADFAEKKGTRISKLNTGSGQNRNRRDYFNAISGNAQDFHV